MKIRDILTVLALSELGMQCVDANKMSIEEFKTLFNSCDIDKMGELFKTDEAIALEELKNMIKEYSEKIGEEQKENESNKVCL